MNGDTAVEVRPKDRGQASCIWRHLRMKWIGSRSSHWSALPYERAATPGPAGPAVPGDTGAGADRARGWRSLGQAETGCHAGVGERLRR